MRRTLVRWILFGALAVPAILILSGCPQPGASNGSSSPQTVAPPTFSPRAGTYSSDQSVTISDTIAGVTVYYTITAGTTGTTPTTSSTKYGGPVSVVGNGTTVTIEAFAAESGMTDSAVAAATFTINYSQVATPTFSPSGGTYSSDQTVTIGDSTNGAKIYCTVTPGTTGTTPTTSSTKYTGSISVAGDGTVVTIEAIAAESGFATSGVASATYAIAYTQVSTPTFSLAAGTYSSNQTVTISCATPNATVYYTTDGSTPTTASTGYSAAIAVTQSMTIKALATAAGMATSAVASVVYVIPGSTWTARTLPSSQYWSSVAYGNGVFVAVAFNSGAAAISPDGITWTANTLPFNAYWSSVTHGNGMFVAVSENAGIAATSPDGITWTA